MTKKANHYELTLKPISLTNKDLTPAPLTITFDNHDEIFGIIERVKEKDPFNDKEQATQFAIGLKMFSEVMIKNRKHELFTELQPAFTEFMKRLKQS